MSTYIINVTKEHIAQGEREERDYCDSCPIALAISEMLGVTVHVTYGDKKRVHAVISGREIDLPAEVADRIVRYDADGQMLPFTFKLEVPA